jgi:hypothetical protein
MKVSDSPVGFLILFEEDCLLQKKMIASAQEKKKCRLTDSE